MCESMNERSEVFKTASALYLGFARKRIERHFLICNVSTVSRATGSPRATG
jgi:hypothetical protein